MLPRVRDPPRLFSTAAGSPELRPVRRMIPELTKRLYAFEKSIMFMPNCVEFDFTIILKVKKKTISFE